MEIVTLLNKALIPLVQNLVFLASFVAIYSLGQRYLTRLQPRHQQLVFGLVFGVIAVIGMLSPIRVVQGIVIDPRTIIILSTGLFIGLQAGLIVAIITAIARIIIGGVGVIAGVGAIGIMLVVIIIFRRRWQDKLHQQPNSAYLLLGVIVLAAHVPFAILIPEGAIDDIFSLAIPLALFYVIGTFLTVALLAREIRQQEMATHLHSSEAQTRSLYNVLPDMLVRLDRNGTFLEVKPAETFSPLFPPQQLIGQQLQDTLPPHIAEQTFKYIQDVLTTAETVPYEYQLEVNGDTRDYEARMVAIGTDEVLSVIRDVTDQRRAERSLRESEAQVASIIDTMPAAVYIFDLVERRNVYMSPEASRILGFSPDEIQATGSSLFEYMVHPDEMSRMPELLARFDNAHDGDILESEIRWRSASGEWLDLQFYDVIFKRNPDGTPCQILGTFRDITQSKKAADMLAYQANILENVSDAIIATDSDFVITSWNKAAEKIYGWAAAEAIGQTMRSLTRPEFEDGSPAAITTAFNKQGFWSGENLQHRKDGSIIHIASATTLLRDANNEPIGAVTVNRDITHRKQLEKREREWRQEREKMDLLYTFTNTVSHDFRTPISTIITTLYLLRQERDPDKHIERIDMVETQVMRLNQFIDDILTMIRLDSGEVFTIEPFDAEFMIERILKRLKQNKRHDNIPAVSVHIADDVPFIRGDDIALERAVYRVVENAVQFTPPDGTVELNIIHEDEQIIISVRDTGMGIAPDVLPHIFERLYRGEAARPAHQGGTGLGLPIAKGIIEGHGGTITVESTPGEGSIFRMSIPIQS